VKPPKLASPLKGKVEFPPSAEAPEGKSVARYELFVDGVRRAACREGERLQLDTTTLPDGPHEFRLVAVVADAIQTQGRAAWSDTVANHGRSVQLALDGASDVPLGQPLTLRVTASQASAIELHCRGQMLARIEQAEGQFSLDTRRLGLGQARLGAVAFLGDGKEPAAVSSLVIARVAEPPALEAIRAPEGVEWAKGISVKAADRPARMAEDSAALNWLQDLGVQPGEPIELEGYVDVQADDLYQFQFRSPRRVQMKVDDTTVCSSDNEHWKFVPVVLNSGTHRLHVTVSGDGPPQMSLRFGGPGATSIGARQFRSPREKEPGGQ
jgi:hypothetical protein